MADLELSRIYLAGFVPRDFAGMEIRENSIIVEPIRPPKQGTESAIILPGAKTDELPGTMCLLYRVIAKGKQTRPEDIQVEVGDTIIIINALADPLHTDMNVLWVDAKNIKTKVKR